MDRIEIHESLESVKLPWEAPQLAAFDIRDATPAWRQHRVRWRRGNEPYLTPA